MVTPVDRNQSILDSEGHVCIELFNFPNYSWTQKPFLDLLKGLSSEFATLFTLMLAIHSYGLDSL